MSGADHVPAGYQVDHYAPDRFVVRCPDCETSRTRTSRMSKQVRRCRWCGRLRAVTPVSEVDTNAPGEGQRAMTDGGQPAEQRQADALEALTDQTRIQNALLLEIVHEQRARRRLAEGKMPLEFSSKSAATAIEDRALELAEQVDLDSVALWSDEEPLTDGGDVVGPDDSAEPEHECANCGAMYNGRGAALQCCSEDARTDGGQLQERDKPVSTKHRSVDPLNLGSRTPAIVLSSNVGEHFCADYKILSSGWVRVVDWDGETWKYPPHKIGAIRGVKTERYGERDSQGFRPKRLADEELIEEAREKGGAGDDA
jgi:hypothetical protein